MTKEELVEELASLVVNQISPDFNDEVAMANADAAYNEAVIAYKKMPARDLRKMYNDEFG
jgi:hypothetical protein